MKLCSFRAAGRDRYGIVVDHGIVDATRHISASSLRQAFSDFRALEAMTNREADFALEAVEFLPVIPDAGKIFSVLLNYESLRLEQGRPKLQYPHLLTRLSDTQIGHGGALQKPRASAEFDYEGELAVVIGRSGRDISAAEATDYIAGYTCCNDATPRDWMRHSRHFTLAKSFPKTGAFGPWLVTRDAMPDLGDCRLTTLLNGQVMQNAVLGDFTYPISELISYISRATPLSEGDIICTGTPAGCGYKRSPPCFLKAGDTVSVSITGIGTLTNSVVDEN